MWSAVSHSIEVILRWIPEVTAVFHLGTAVIGFVVGVSEATRRLRVPSGRRRSRLGRSTLPGVDTEPADGDLLRVGRSTVAAAGAWVATGASNP
jgi:hypothetical protein